MIPQEKESLRLEAASLREDLTHLTSRIAFQEQWSDATLLATELQKIKRKIDSLEAYANALVKTHNDRESSNALRCEMTRKNNRITQIASLLMSDRRATASEGKLQQTSKRSSNRVGCLSEEKTKELCKNLGMTVEKLKLALNRKD